MGRLCLFCGQVLCLKQQTPPWERTVENKSNIHMQAGSAVRLPFVFVSLVGWPFSREYQQDMLTLHDWDPGLNQSCGFRHGNGRNRRGVLKEQAAVYFGSLSLTQLQCQCVLTEPAPVRWCASFWKVGQQRYRHGSEMQPKQWWAVLYVETGRKWITQRAGSPHGVWRMKRQVQVNIQ